MTKPAIALFRKDLRVTRILWAPMAFSYFVFLLAFMENVWIYLATGACLTFVMAATAMGIDDRHGTEPLFAALPGTRRSLVKGKYLSWVAFTAAGLGIFLVSTALLVAALGERSPRLASLLSVKGAAAFLAGTALTGLVFNIEILERVGTENFFVFGLTAGEVMALKPRGYNPLDYYDNNPALRRAIDSIASGEFSEGDPAVFEPIVRSLLEADDYLSMADYQSYVDCCERAADAYGDQDTWTRMSILNVARSGYFSSDRVVREYAKEIWRVDPVPVP